MESKTQEKYDIGTITAERVVRWYKLLCEFGIDEFFQTVIDRPKQIIGKAVTAEQQVTGVLPDNGEDAIQIKVDIQGMMRAFSKGDALYEMVSIVMNTDEPKSVDMVVFAECIPFFVRVSLKPMNALFGTPALLGTA